MGWSTEEAAGLGKAEWPRALTYVAIGLWAVSAAAHAAYAELVALTFADLLTLALGDPPS